MPDQLEITYRARGGRFPVDLDLHLGSDGQARVYVGTTYSIPLARVSRVGVFSGLAPTAEVNALHTYFGEHDLLARGGSYGEWSPDSPTRFLEIRADGREAQLNLDGMTADAEIDPFEQLLLGLALAMTDQPTRAVEATLDLRPVDGQIAATIELRSIGSEPMPALLVDPAQPNLGLRASVGLVGKMPVPGNPPMPMPLGDVALTPDAVQAMVDSGAIPSGITELAPGATYRLDLPRLARPQSPNPVFATGTVSFWFLDGQARRGVTVVTQETPLS